MSCYSSFDVRMDSQRNSSNWPEKHLHSLQLTIKSVHAGSDNFKASTIDNGNGTYSVNFQVDRAGIWCIIPRFASPTPQSDESVLTASSVHHVL